MQATKWSSETLAKLAQVPLTFVSKFSERILVALLLFNYA